MRTDGEDPSPTTIRPFDPARDLEAVWTVWDRCLGATWPIEPALLGRFLAEHPWYRPGDHLVAEEGDAVVGFVATQVHRGTIAPSTTGGIGLLLVTPERQRRRIGTHLLSRALDHLRGNGVERVEVGGGGGTWRLWPGIPPSLAPSSGFFERAGFAPSDPSFDLIQDLRTAPAMPDLPSRLSAAGLRTSISSPADEGDLMAFEGRHFPAWGEHYHDAFRVGDRRDVLIVRDAGSEIVGALLLFDRDSRHFAAQVPWQGLLGADMGGLAGVGVAGDRQGAGVGSLLVRAGNEILRERGVGTCYIEWTSRPTFYRRLGFSPWQEYAMLARELPS